MVEDIGCEGEEGAKRGFGLGVGLRGAGHELIAEELIGVREIIRAQEYGGLRLRSFLLVSTSLELRGFFTTYSPANCSLASSIFAAGVADLIGARIPSPM